MKNKETILDYLLIFLGCLSLAFAINSFFLPNNLVTGGFSGLSIIITRYLESVFGINVQISVVMLCLNLPLFILTFFLIGYRMVIRSFFATLSVSFWLSILAHLPIIELDIFLAATFGALFSGFGLGLVFSRSSTTGGTDLVAKIANKYIKHINVSKLLFYIDTGIIILGLFAFGIENCMYAIISVFVCTNVIKTVLEGVNFAKVVYIITDHYEELSQAILVELDKGVTGLESKGMYTNKQRVTLMTVIPAKDIPKLKEVTHRVDENAFIIMSDAKEVLGEGFNK